MLLAPLRAIADKSFYREVAAKSGQWLFGYVVLLGFAFSLAATVSLALKVSPLLRETVDWASAAIPPITFSAGKVSVAAPGPIKIQHPKVPSLAIAIDTNRTAPVTPQEMQEQKLSIYLTQSTLYLSPRPDRVEAYDLSKIVGAPKEPTVLDASFYRAVGDALPKVLFPVMFFMAWMVFVVWKLGASVIYAALLGLPINAAVSGSGLEFPALWKLAIVAQTPVVGLQMAQLFLPAPIPFFFVVAVLVTGAYLWQAVKQNAPAAAAPPA